MSGLRRGAAPTFGIDATDRPHAVTLVLALRCREGVVLASDGQATSEAAGQPTRQPTRKLFALGGWLAWGAAGSLGLQQAVAERLAALADSRPDPASLRERLAEAVIPVQQRALCDYVAQPGSAPPDLACLFCWYDGGAPRILSLPRTGSDHQFHDRHCAIGSGDIFADFAMASVAHLDTPALDLEQAKIVAYKAIADAIDVAAVYLGPPIQMCVVLPAGVRAVPAAEVDGPLADRVEAWKSRQRETLGPPVPASRALPVLGRRTAPTSR